MISIWQCLTITALDVCCNAWGSSTCLGPAKKYAALLVLHSYCRATAIVKSTLPHNGQIAAFCAPLPQVHAVQVMEYILLMLYLLKHC